MTTQVPLWVTLALGLIAILGPIGGALIAGLITARRDDMRWQRELEREQIRWRRDTEQNERQYWRARRIESYASFINCWLRFNDAAGDFLAHVRLNSTNLLDEIDAVTVAREHLETAASVVHIESSERTRGPIVQTQLQAAQLLVKLQEMVVSVMRDGKAKIAEEDISDTTLRLRGIFDNLNRFIDLVREELGVPTLVAHIDDQYIQARP